METNEDNGQEVTTHSFPFDFERFDFLDKSLKQIKDECDLKTNRLRITCFDVNQNYFVFGTNCGLIYCFRRSVFNSQQLFRYRLFSSPINFIKLITDELLSFVTESGVYVWNRFSRKFLYGWKCPTKAVITCLQTFMSISDRKLLLFSGDSDGCVRFHDLLKCQQNIVYKDFGFQIIQIEFIDSRTLLISSAFKTVVVKINFSDTNPQKMAIVGKNERKTCGKFGAIFSHKSGLIYGSRPSLHLIKAETSGNVIETIRINNIRETDCSDILEDCIEKSITGKLVYKLGVLQLFCNEQYIISVNDSNLLIIRTDGDFCIKEKIDKLIDVKISAANSNEAFLLLESKHIIRIRNNQMANGADSEASGEYEKSSEYEDKSTDSKSSNESLLSLIRGPVAVNPLPFIDDELKKVFDFNAIQTKLAKKYNQLSASIISTIDPKILPNSDKNVFVDPEYDYNISEHIDANSSVIDGSEMVTPLVVTRKARRRIRHNSSDSQMTVNSTSDSVNSNEELAPKTVGQTLDKMVSTNQTGLDTVDTNEDNRLEMILSAYREANNLIDPIERQPEDFTIEDYQLSNGIQMEVTKSDIGLESNQYLVDIKLTESTAIPIDTQEAELRVKDVNYCWQLMIRLNETIPTKNIMFSSFCSYGYNSSSDIGLIWLISPNHNSLVYYPSFDSLKLSKGRPHDIACATYELYVLNDSGLIWKRDGMDATKPVGTKWSLIRANKSRFKLTSISFNMKTSIIWCCDANGETWTHQIKVQKWLPIKDFSSHSIEMRKVCVSPIDSTIVWGLDKSGKVFVRSFMKSGDNSSNFCGDEWLLMDIILAIDIVVCCDNFVLIVDQSSQIFRRSAVIGPKDKLNEWKPVNSPDIGDNDSIISLSVTENNDLMVMTTNGSIWHTFTKTDRHSVQEDLDWLLI